MSSPKKHRKALSRRASQALALASLAVAALGIFLLARIWRGSTVQHASSDASSAASSEDGSQLLRDQQDTHLTQGEIDRLSRVAVQKHGETARLAGVVQKPRPPGWPFHPLDYPKPKTFFDIAIDGKPAGRIVFELFTKQAPRAAENFRALCTGEKGRAVVEGHPGPRLHYKGAEFYRVIDRFICQTGIETPSIYGGAFDDDPGALDLRHDKKGLLSAANIGHNTTTTHFSIVVAPAPHLNGNYPIFGQVVQGMDVVDRINALAKPAGSADERPQLPVVVSNCGELKCDAQNVCKEITLQEV